MFEMIYSTNVKSRLKKVKSLWDSEVSELKDEYKKNLSLNDFLEIQEDRYGNLSRYVLYVSRFMMGRIAQEYILLYTKDLKTNKEFLELRLIGFDTEIINSYKEYDGYYTLLERIELKGEESIDIIVRRLRSYIDKDVPIKMYV